MEIYAVERDAPGLGTVDMGYFRNKEDAERIKNEWNAQCKTSWDHAWVRKVIVQ